MISNDQEINKNKTLATLFLITAHSMSKCLMNFTFCVVQYFAKLQISKLVISDWTYFGKNVCILFFIFFAY